MLRCLVGASEEVGGTLKVRNSLTLTKKLIFNEKFEESINKVILMIEIFAKNF